MMQMKIADRGAIPVGAQMGGSAMAKTLNKTIAGLYGVVLEKTRPLEEYELLLECVSKTCRERAARFRRRMDGENTVLGELLLRELLRSLTGLSTISLGRDSFGKPFWREEPAVQVNISHSGGFVACAVAPTPVGIDVQVSNRASPALVRRFFTPEEARYVMEGIDDEQALRFCHIWTMKESYIKRDGRGLRIPLQSFDVLQIQRSQPTLFREIPLAPQASCQICCDTPVVGRLLHLKVHEFLENGLPLDREPDVESAYLGERL